MANILITGGSGFVAQALIPTLIQEGHQINVLTRGATQNVDNVKYFHWNVDNEIIDIAAFENIDTIINLAGASIGEGRWTKSRKKIILNSRVKSVEFFSDVIKNNNLPIKRIISSSATGYYGAVTNEEIYEETDTVGSDFLAQVCKEWENAVKRFESLNVKVIILRKGVIVGKSGGVYTKMSPLVKLGINPTMGNGKQIMPWLSLLDLIKLYSFLINNTSFSGVLNAVAPTHMSMQDFTKALFKSFNKKSWTPNVPTFIIKIGLGEMSMMLLEGSKVSSEKLSSLGFKFDYPSIQEALESCK